MFLWKNGWLIGSVKNVSGRKNKRNNGKVVSKRDRRKSKSSKKVHFAPSLIRRCSLLYRN
jgi:hypothetical protein